MPSVYNKNRVTKKGYNLLAESIATKKPVTFTKVVIGDGDDNGLNIDTMTNVVSEKLTLPVLNGQKDGDGQYLVTAVLSNSTVETGFFPKEVALFAKCGDGEEILYSYSNGGNNVGLIPDKNTPINSEIYNIRTKIGNATNITFVTSDETYITKGELVKHNESEHAHDNRFNAIIEKVNNMITPTDDSDKQSLAPTLALVKELIKEHNDNSNAHDNLLTKIKQVVLDMMTWKNVPGLTKVGHFSFSNALKEIPLPTGWRRLKVCVAWNGDTTDFNKFTQNMFPRLLEPNNGAVREFDVMQVKLSNNKQFSVLDEDGFGYTINESKLIITSAGKDGNDYIVAMYYM